MESSISTENLAPKMSNEYGRFQLMQLVLVVIALVVAVVALVVAFVGLSQKGTTQITVPGYEGEKSASAVSSSGTSSDDRIWTIATESGPYREAYLDEKTGLLKGFIIDYTNAVCRIANKNCRIIYDLWDRCWEPAGLKATRGGIGLMSGWYDGCAGWSATHDRYRTFGFTEPYGRTSEETLWVKKGSPLKTSWRNQAGKKIGLLDGWKTDQFCLNRNADSFTSGTPFTADSVIHYKTQEDFHNALVNGEVDYGFLSVSYVDDQLERVEGDPVLSCTVHGPGIMVRKVNQEFVNWWNEAQKRLMATTEYQTICQDLEDVHGDQQGQAPTEHCFL